MNTNTDSSTVSRRQFLSAAVGIAAMGGFYPAWSAPKAKKPNILWISCEDISSHLGCYGDKNAPPNTFAKPGITVRIIPKKIVISTLPKPPGMNPAKRPIGKTVSALEAVKKINTVCGKEKYIGRLCNRILTLLQEDKNDL